MQISWLFYLDVALIQTHKYQTLLGYSKHYSVPIKPEAVMNELWQAAWDYVSSTEKPIRLSTPLLAKPLESVRNRIIRPVGLRQA